MTATNEPTRVLVCGTGFGRIYLRALEEPGPLELAGILARGGDRSRACAGHYRVPLHTTPESVPDGIDLACVVVPNGVGGGPGAQLAGTLLARGIPVLLEHPAHAAELAGCLRVAARHRVPFRINTFYSHLAPVRRFLAAARELLRRQPATFVDVSGSVQIAYNLLDIAGQALGALGPWALADPPAVPARLRGLTDHPFGYRCLDAVLGGVPATLRIHNLVDPRDPDHHSHLQHRILLGTEAGTLVLASTHGPVLWCPAMRVPKAVDGSFALDGNGPETLVPSVVPLGPATAPGCREVFDQVWPAAARRALLRMRQSILDGEDPVRAGQYYLTLSRLWADLTGRLGYPPSQRRPPAGPIDAEDLLAAIHAEAVEGK